MKRTHLFALILSVLGLSVLFMSFSSFDPPTQGQAKQGGQNVYDKSGKLLQVRYIRKNAHEDSENMQILADALKKMKEMDCTDPMSWYMQGAIHGAPDTNNIFCPDYKAARNPAWHNCTHASEPLGLTDDGARMHFYTWHKSYLEHFENVIRYVSKKPNFSLPYWEYDNSQYQTLPPLLLDKNSSLYEEFRNNNMNSGNNITVDTFGTPSNFTSPNSAYNNQSFHFFTRDLENVPHNLMHVYLGYSPTNSGKDPIGYQVNYGYMIELYSPMDPVFWIHHANIDRLYEKWLIGKIDDKIGNGGRPQKSRFIRDKWIYRFFKPGAKDAKDLTEYKDLGKVFDDLFGVQDYAYDMFLNNGTYNKKYEDKVRKAIAKNTWNYSAFETVDVVIGEQDKDKRAGGIADPEFKINFGLENPKIKGTKRATWVLDLDVEFSKQPNGAFDVFIRDPEFKSREGVSDKFKKFRRAGTMTFFGIGHNHSHRTEEGLHQHNEDTRHEVNFEFDISEEIYFPQFIERNISTLEFKIIPTNPADQIIIDKIQLIKQIVKKQ